MIEGMNRMPAEARLNDAAGVAALAICESLLLALRDLKIISEKDVRDLLDDVVTTYGEAAAGFTNGRETSGGAQDCSAHPGQQGRKAARLLSTC
jgi:hypothetical protein